jgi:hypothetical protein
VPSSVRWSSARSSSASASNSSTSLRMRCWSSAFGVSREAAVHH